MGDTVLWSLSADTQAEPASHSVAVMYTHGSFRTSRVASGWVDRVAKA